MGIYGRFVLPRLIDCTMKDKAAATRRSELIPRATGSVLEIGIPRGPATDDVHFRGLRMPLSAPYGVAMPASGSFSGTALPEYSPASG